MMKQALNSARILVCVLFLSTGSAFAGHSTPQPTARPSSETTSVQLAPVYGEDALSDPTQVNGSEELSTELTLILISSLLHLVW